MVGIGTEIGEKMRGGGGRGEVKHVWKLPLNKVRFELDFEEYERFIRESKTKGQNTRMNRKNKVM